MLIEDMVPSTSRPDAATTKTVCVQGLGFVGAANAVAIASARDALGEPRFRVIGVELATERGRERAAAINEGRFPFPTTDRDLIRATRDARAAGNLSAEIGCAALAEADVIVMNVGLDLDHEAGGAAFDLDPFLAAIATVGENMRPDALVLLESTVPPGASERIVAPTLRDCLRARGLPPERLRLAYCYERVMPGDAYLASIVDMCRVYAALTPAAADDAEEFLSNYIDVARKPLFRLTNIRSAELAKVLENTYRAVNIALIDEWERFARRIGVDLFEVLEAVRIRPTHSNIRYPGLGVGGYCLTKDPLFGPASASALYGLDNLEFPLSSASVRINDAMPLVSAHAIDGLLPGGLRGKRVLILGASYRPNIGDTRCSPSIVLAKGLLARGAEVEFSDPLVTTLEEIDAPLYRALPDPHRFDILVFAVAHQEYRGVAVVEWIGDARALVFDANGVFSSDELRAIRKAGIRVAAIGRGELA
jgi:nucleotide sugar dehydrogenase